MEKWADWFDIAIAFLLGGALFVALYRLQEWYRARQRAKRIAEAFARGLSAVLTAAAEAQRQQRVESEEKDDGTTD